MVAARSTVWYTCGFAFDSVGVGIVTTSVVVGG